ncbi:hypothetical protein Clacol_009965 [Clathrus columnatus]|uniref:DASH complex subunit DAD1 n=1 Tax=Clathrus columnatus TaxID=1419009 RepID=A0AAV5API7_9AGAM|nr:hypothetical protein Clacol_009965 [Clathrus columnatus]
MNASKPGEEDQSFFERERDRLCNEISRDLEELLSSTNMLSRKLEDVLGMRKELEPITEIWECFYELMRQWKPDVELGMDGQASQETVLPLDQADQAYKVIKTSDLRGIQVFPPPFRLVITIEGNVDGSAVCAEQIRHSAVGKHLLECLRKNSNTLSIHDISDISVENNKATSAPVYFSSSHAHYDGPSSPHLNFLSLNLIYTWTSDLTETEGLNCETSPACGALFNPITSSRVSPFVKLLDRIGHGLLSRHIIRRYPWTFGPYSQAIRRERAYFPLMAKSLCSIIGKSNNQSSKSKFLAEVEVRDLASREESLSQLRICRFQKIRRKNALHDHFSYQYISGIIREKKDSPNCDVINNHEHEEQDEPFVPVLEQCLTTLYAKGVKPWVKGLHGYFDTSDDGSSISSTLDPTFGDVPTPLDLPSSGPDETPELDWSSSAESDIDKVAFEFTQDLDGYDEDIFIMCSSDIHKDFELVNMSFNRDTSEALFDESAGNLANLDDHGCLENTKEKKVLVEDSFTPRDNLSLTKSNAEPNLSPKELFLKQVPLIAINKVHGADEDSNWSKTDMEDSSNDFSQFESSKKHGPLLSCGQVGQVSQSSRSSSRRKMAFIESLAQEYPAHVDDMFYCESDSDIEWDLVHSQLVDL